MSFFLRLKHWQLFLLLFVVPFVLELVTMGTVVATQDIVWMMRIFPVIMIVIIGLLAGWLHAMGTRLHRRLPEGVRMNLTLFRIFLAVPVVYMTGLMILLSAMFRYLMRTLPYQTPEAGIPPELFSFLKIAFLIIPLHLFSLFCIFYCLYFVARSLKAVELQRPVTFSDYIGEFFLLWFWLVGVWFIQPRINRIFGVQADAEKELPVRF